MEKAEQDNLNFSKREVEDYERSDKNEEKRELDLMRAIIEKEDPQFKEIDNFTLRRFLRARDLNAEKAAEMFMKYTTWRRSFVPTGSISTSEIANELQQNKFFMQGTDKKGCPIGFVLGAKHFPRKQGTDEFKRGAVFLLDRLCSRIPEGQENFTLIADLKGYGYSNTDVRGFISIFSVLQDYYPGRLGKLLILHTPYIFKTAWKIIYPFIDKSIKSKIMFVENKDLHDTLREYIDESQLPDIYGGKLKLVPIQES